MANGKKLNIIAMLTVTLALILSAVTFCWLDGTSGTVTFDDNFHGSTQAAYFAGGDGTAENPYQIEDPVHLYNLAWLQYLGYFNMNDSFNNGLTQSHFIVTKDINMSSIRSAIPPIGTAEYPFIGVFNGGDHTITSAKISNEKGNGESMLRIRPSNAKFNDSTSLLSTAGNTEEVSIVGLFGVTGDYNDYITSYQSSNTSFTDEYKTAMKVTNFYTDKLHVYSGSASTLTGLVAGYAGSNITNVGVYRADIKYASGANGLSSLSGSTNINSAVTSKYALVGEFKDSVIEWGDITSSGGDGNGWGDSIDISALNTRITSKFATSSYQWADSLLGLHDENADSIYSYKYLLDGDSSLYIDDSKSKSTTSDSFTYVLGKKQQKIDSTSGDGTALVSGTIAGYKISFIDNGTRYVYRNPNSGSSFGRMNPTSTESNAHIWYVCQDGSNYYLYTIVDKKVYYVYTNGNFLYTSETEKSSVSFGNSDITSTSLAEGSSTDSTIVFNGKKYYGYRFSISDSSNNGTYTFTFVKQAMNSTTVSGYNINVDETDRSTQSYFPIDTDTAKNVGYIASGDGAGIRIGEYKKSTFDSTVYTINGSGKTTQDTSGEDYQNVVGKCGITNGGSSAYGMHFMNATVDTDNLYRAKTAYILDSTKTDYQMTANSIDFQVAKKGAIRFLAGTCFEGNTAFFALYHIIRSGNDITAVKQISKIYSQSSSETYVYQYTDGTYSSTSTSGLTQIFDCAWITNPGSALENNKLYYFAVPVNAGEYALGSETNLTGAYLFYLDIGASNEGSGTTGKAYTIKSLYFVNTDTVALNTDGSYPTFNSVTFTISNAGSGSPWIAFERNATGDTSIVRYNYDAIVTVTPTGNGTKDDSLTASSDDS